MIPPGFYDVNLGGSVFAYGSKLTMDINQFCGNFWAYGFKG